MTDDEARKFAETLEAGKSDYERAQGGPDAGGISKKAGLDMISATADNAHRRTKKRGRT